MTNNERIEAYFNNELPEADRQQLLQDMDADLGLKSDFQFQENIIEGIKAYRKKELIARLDAVQIASPGQAILLKTLVGVGIAGIITLGTFLWVNNANENTIPEQVSNTEQVVTQTEDTQEVVQPPTDSRLAEEPKTEVQEKVTEATKTKSAPAKSKQNQTADVPNIVIPDVQEPEAESSANVEEDLTAPKAMSSSAIRLRSSTDVEVKLDKKYTFHYQVKNGGLTLFGKFNESPFEVIELKTNRGINSYLYFKDHFYSLANDSEEIRPLMVIENDQLIKELQKRR